jgi:ABC-type polysaccharide/polyol phosphate export permease
MEKFWMNVLGLFLLATGTAFFTADIIIHRLNDKTNLYSLFVGLFLILTGAIFTANGIKNKP